jgi:hypothetical protein
MTAIVTDHATNICNTLTGIRALVKLQAAHGYPELDHYTDQIHKLYEQAAAFQHDLQSIILHLTLAQTTR